MKLYSWIHYMPLGVVPDGLHNSHVRQTSCWIVLKTDKEFRERLGYGLADFKHFVSVEKPIRHDHANPGARLAVANPGTLYYKDIWNHSQGEEAYVALEDA